MNIPKPIPQPLHPLDLKRFRSKVHRGKPKECWPWLAGLSNAGYGSFSILCEDGKNRTFHAHRLALSLHLGRDLIQNALHTCDNPACCNPKHLYEGSQRDNVRDEVRRGRFRGHFSTNNCAGANHPKAKLTEIDVVSIRQLSALGFPRSFLVRSFGVTKSCIQHVLNGLTWKSVDEADWLDPSE